MDCGGERVAWPVRWTRRGEIDLAAPRRGRWTQYAKLAAPRGAGLAIAVRP